MKRWIVGLFALAFVLVACSSNASTATPPAGTTTNFAGKTLTVVTHDSFAVSTSVISDFEKLTGAKVQIVESGDAGAALNKSILAAGAPLGDVQFGIDNTFLSRALEANIFEPYAPKNLDQVPADLKLDPQNRLIPIDYGYVNINYDKAALAQTGLALPTDVRDLTKPEWKGKLVVQNPATSSPGLAFLLATIDHFGESGDYTWRNFWADLRANDVKITSGWEDAYYTEFAGGGSGGAYPLVVSYATSPAAAVIFSTTPLTDAPTGNLSLDGGVFRQIEFAGLLKGAKEPELGKAWLDFMLSDTFQSDVGGQMFVYPALPSAKTPAEFAKYAQVPSQTTKLTPDDIAKNRERWLAEWNETVIR